MSQDRLSNLFTAFITKQETPAEREELMTLLLEPENEMAVRRIINDHLETMKINELLSANTTNAIIKAILQADPAKLPSATVSEEEPPRINFIQKNWLRYAAAIILIAGATTLWLMVEKRFPAGMTGGRHISNVAANIVPGSEKAVLTLASGQQITLDNTQGNIVQQGNLKVINVNGQLDYEGKGTMPEYHTLSTPRGGQYKVQLPDGSMVWLNAASSITYPTVFAGADRKVTVTGEAYFEVAKNKQLPFRVQINPETVVEVLGTSFNINAYNNEPVIRTTLLQGSVRVQAAGQQKLLQPNDQAVITGTALNIVTVNTDETIAWKNALFNFNGADLPTVLRQLERWYDIEVKYAEGKNNDLRFRGKLPRDLSLPQVLKTLEYVNVKFRLEGRTLIVE